MNAFIAWTPLHVINIINTTINYFPGVKNDLFIYDEFNGADDIYRELIKMNIFCNVYKISYKDTGNTLTKGFNMLINNQNLVSLDTTYDNLFIQGGNYFSKILYGETKKKNKQVELHYIEDGLGAYTSSPIIRIDTPAKKIVKLLNRHSMYHAKIDSYYVYEPDLVAKKHDAPYYKLPKLNYENDARLIIMTVFGLNDASDRQLADKILFFDQPFVNDGFSIDEKAFINEVRKMSLEEPITIKLHPRSVTDKYGDIDILETDLPWELYCLNLEMDNVYLLSIGTTAAFTPYLMFGLEMPVIILASYYLKKLKAEKGNEQTMTMLENIVSFSHNYQKNVGAKSHMPESLDELAELLRKH